jgi:hypothetical protein
MTPSPEERAKAICARITHFADWRDREEIIAFAITDAELDAMREIRDSLDAGICTENMEDARQMFVDCITAMILIKQSGR